MFLLLLLISWTVAEQPTSNASNDTLSYDDEDEDVKLIDANGNNPKIQTDPAQCLYGINIQNYNIFVVNPQDGQVFASLSGKLAPPPPTFDCLA